MRNSRNPRDIRGALNQIDRILHRLRDIRERRPSTRTRDTRRILSSDTNNSQLILRIDMKRLDGSIQDGVVGLDVGRDDGEGEIGEEIGQLFGSAVEFVVAEGHAVEAHLVEGFGDLLPAVVGVEERALGRNEVRR